MKRYILILIVLIFNVGTANGQILPNKMYKVITDGFNIQELPDSSALYTFHFKFIVKNKRIKSFEVYPNEYSKYFHKDSFSDRDIIVPTKKRNATLILPVVYTIVSNKGKLPYGINISNGVINNNRILNLFRLNEQDKKYIYLRPYLPTYVTVIYD